MKRGALLAGWNPPTPSLRGVFRSLISFQPGRWIGKGEGGLLRFVGFFRYRTEHRLEFESGRGKLENVD